MLHKKLILMGGSAVGKTSLIARWVKGIFSEKYIATIGVKIEKKTLQVNSEQLVLLIWDLQGESELTGHIQAYVQGAEACLFVADGTRRETLQYVFRLREQVIKELGDIPFALALNKEDRANEWQVSSENISNLEKDGWPVFKTSAKSGNGIDSVFLHLSRRLLHLQERRNSI